MATQFIHTIFTSLSLPALHAELQNTLSAQNWTETLATAILDALTKALEIDVPMGKAVKEAFEKASKEVGEWARENPELATLILVVIALGILVVVMPWVIDALGFEVVGPRLGSYAARWQRLYGGATPGGSLFSYLQRMGMVGGKWAVAKAML